MPNVVTVFKEIGSPRQFDVAEDVRNILARLLNTCPMTRNANAEWLILDVWKTRRRLQGRKPIRKPKADELAVVSLVMPPYIPDHSCLHIVVLANKKRHLYKLYIPQWLRMSGLERELKNTTEELWGKTIRDTE